MLTVLDNAHWTVFTVNEATCQLHGGRHLPRPTSTYTPKPYIGCMKCRAYMVQVAQFAGSSGPVPYTLRVFNWAKWVFRLSDRRDSLGTEENIMIVFMRVRCKAAVMIKLVLRVREQNSLFWPWSEWLLKAWNGCHSMHGSFHAK